MPDINVYKRAEPLGPYLDHYWPPLFEQFHDIAVFLDTQTYIYHANNAWKNFQQPDDQAQQPFKMWLYPEDVIKLQVALMSEITQKIHVRMLRKDAMLIWMALNIEPIYHHFPQRNRPPQLLGWCVLGHEQTEQIRQQQQKYAQQRSLKDLLSRIPVMLYRSRNDWNWTMDYVSRGCEKVTGYPRHALLNTPLYGQSIHPEDQQYVWDQIQYGLQHHQVFFLQYRIITADQRIQWVQETGQGLYSESDMVLGVEGAVCLSQAI
ncbi:MULTISPECIES: PAS domain-containing protein [unclassified Acinetobacter]|uniref:PAS domain-containing protein n=1 Tax=unclassified Acinetobacter TaxID=196816 RepID=UPI002935145D|nr:MULTISPECIES: PAS domain-containing protein [unclassified Acinetobacter]WOE32458.1 PAS domain-containing protein [Acinetobacter sp. SAAs470]WOE37933.1 PAS domain-containing protein [Acinetobacter sp. SAAs474]